MEIKTFSFDSVCFNNECIVILLEIQTSVIFRSSLLEECGIHNRIVVRIFFIVNSILISVMNEKRDINV